MAQPLRGDFPLPKPPPMRFTRAKLFKPETLPMKFRLALTAAATIALAACGSTEDASTEAEADTVEMPADVALEEIDVMPVEDPAASVDTGDTATETGASEAEQAQIQEAGDNAADTAAAAMDAMNNDSGN